jgi:hypothetical protein
MSFIKSIIYKLSMNNNLGPTILDVLVVDELEGEEIEVENLL